MGQPGPKGAALADPAAEARRQKKLAYQREYYRKNKKRAAEYNRKYRESQKEAGTWFSASKNADLKKKYGITLEKYEQMLDDQHGLCASCGSTPGIKSLVVDHDHVTGQVRGLLCTNCNIAFGHLQETPDRVAALLAYALSFENVLIAQKGA